MPGSAEGRLDRRAGETGGPPTVTRDLGPGPEEAPLRPGRNFVAVIGIDEYAAWPTLHNAVNDAVRVQQLLVEKLGFQPIARPLLNREATRGAIQALIQDELPGRLREDDGLVLFFAGHGHTRLSVVGRRRIESGYLIPAEASRGDHWSEYVKLEPLLVDLSELPARHVLVIFDACRSGFAVGDAMTVERADRSLLYEQSLARQRSRRVITSAQRDEEASDGGGPLAGNSLFTGTLLGGLGGGAADLNGDGLVTSSELGLFLQKAVGRASDSRQTPVFGTFFLDEGGELVIPLTPGAALAWAAPGEGEGESPRDRARRDLAHVWDTWQEEGALPSREDLRRLAEALADVPPADPPQALLLLRAAVAREDPPRPWLDLLRQGEGRATIELLEFGPPGPPEAAPSRAAGISPEGWARRAAPIVLGTGEHEAGVPPEDGPGAAAPTRGFGPVSRAAALGPDPATRQTAALALTLLDGFDGPDRLRRAVCELPGRVRRWSRIGELLAALADARADLDPASGFARMRGELTLPERLGVWAWRVRRRLVRDRRCWGPLAAGGALGAGLAVAALRWAEFRLTPEPGGGQFFSAFYTALPLGAALALGTALAVPLRAAPPDERGVIPGVCRAAGHDQSTAGLALVSGTLCFGLAHLLVALQNGLDPGRHPLVLPAGLLAGLGLSLALRGQPPLAARLGVVGWSLRLGAGALTMVLTVVLVTAASGQWPELRELHRVGPGVVLLLDAYYLSAVLNALDLGARGYYGLVLLDAALVGALLVLGTTLGGALARRLARLE